MDTSATSISSVAAASVGSSASAARPEETPPRPWSETLRSNGKALTLAAKKSNQAVACYTKAAKLLLATASEYATFSETLLQASKSLEANNTGSVGSIRALLQDSATSYGQLALSVQTSNARPLLQFLQTKTADCVVSSYTSSRHDRTASRQAALQARNNYVAVLKDAESSLIDYQKENNNSSNGNFPKRITTRLLQHRDCVAKYKESVEGDRASVRQCVRVEEMGLETLELLEGDRLTILAHSLIHILTAMQVAAASEEESSSSSEGSSSSSGEEEDDDEESEEAAESNPLRRLNSGAMSFDTQEESGAGAMDAETLGLSNELGVLRDKVLSKTLVFGSTVKTARAVASLLDNVALAATKLGQALREQQDFSTEARPFSYESVGKEIEETEAPDSRLPKLYKVLQKKLLQEADAALALASQLHTLRKELMGDLLYYGDEIFRPAVQRDHATWKQLCDARKEESNAEQRYLEATLKTKEIRERCKSFDGDAIKTDLNSAPATAATSAATNATSPASAGTHKHVTQSLANMFALLPNGSEAALKVLDPTTRASVARMTLDDAGQKETKGRQLLDSARELTALSVEAYKSSAETVLKRCEKTEYNVDYSSLLATLEEYIKASQSFRRNIVTDMKDIQLLVPFCGAGVQETVGRWAEEMEKSIQADQEHPVASMALEPCLSFQLEHSEVVQTALERWEGNTAAPASAEAGVASEEKTEDSSPSTPLRPRSAALGLSPHQGDPSTDSPTNWFMRSLMIPTDGGESILNKMTMMGNTINNSAGKAARRPNVVDTETTIFAKYFWPEDLDATTISTVEDSFACSFRDGNQRYPFQYGRIFFLKKRLMFIGWTRRQISVTWTELLDAAPMKNKVNREEDSITISRRKKGSTEESRMVLAGLNDRERVLDVIAKLKEQAKVAPEPVLPNISPASKNAPVSDLPPDAILSKMEILFTKTIRNTSIQSYYDLIWSSKDFYKPWLEKDCFDVIIEDWQQGAFVGPWCGDNFTQRREIKFKVERTTHLYIGPPIAHATQTHYCHVRGNEECVLKMRVEFEGIPYSDTFAVEIRWLARRVADNDIKLEVGVDVDFKKPTFLKSKIRAGTIEESARIHGDLFDTVRAACASANGEEVADEPQVEADSGNTAKAGPEFDLRSLASVMEIDSYVVLGCGMLVLLVFCWRYLSWSTRQSVSVVDLAGLTSRLDGMENEIKAMKGTLNEVLELLKEQRSQKM